MNDDRIGGLLGLWFAIGLLLVAVGLAWAIAVDPYHPPLAPLLLMIPGCTFGVFAIGCLLVGAAEFVVNYIRLCWRMVKGTE